MFITLILLKQIIRKLVVRVYDYNATKVNLVKTFAPKQFLNLSQPPASSWHLVNMRDEWT